MFIIMFTMVNVFPLIKSAWAVRASMLELKSVMEYNNPLLIIRPIATPPIVCLIYPFCRVVNATLKKYRRYHYRYYDLKVAALPLPLLKFKSSGATATSATLPRNSYNKVAYATGHRLKTKVPRRKADVGTMANFTWGCLRDVFMLPRVSKAHVVLKNNLNRASNRIPRHRQYIPVPLYSITTQVRATPSISLDITDILTTL